MKKDKQDEFHEPKRTEMVLNGKPYVPIVSSPDYTNEFVSKGTYGKGVQIGPEER